MARQISVLIFSVVSRDLVNDLDLNLTPLLEVFFPFSNPHFYTHKINRMG